MLTKNVAKASRISWLGAVAGVSVLLALQLVIMLRPHGTAASGDNNGVVTSEPAPAAPAAATVTVDLWATTGSTTMPGGAIIPIWGFTDVDPGVGGTAQLPGPTIDVNAGDSVIINLHNNLTENVSLVFPGLPMLPDGVGAAPGWTVSYAFTASAPGTYLYESGTNSAVQVAMGLYGALLVRPAAPNQAYSNATTAFDSEAVLVLS